MEYTDRMKRSLINTINMLPFNEESFKFLKEELIKSTFPKSISEQVEDKMNKEKQFTSYDSQGPTDFDVVGFHSDTIEDILKLIDICYELFPCNRNNQVLVTSEKLDEIKHYTLKLQRYVGQE